MMMIDQFYTVCVRLRHSFCVADRFPSPFVSLEAKFVVKYEQSFDIYIFGRINSGREL